MDSAEGLKSDVILFLCISRGGVAICSMELQIIPRSVPVLFLITTYLSRYSYHPCSNYGTPIHHFRHRQTDE